MIIVDPCLALVTAFVACRSLLLVSLRLTTAYTNGHVIILVRTNNYNHYWCEYVLSHQ